jgi:hypothetical protein
VLADTSAQRPLISLMNNICLITLVALDLSI